VAIHGRYLSAECIFLKEKTVFELFKARQQLRFIERYLRENYKQTEGDALDAVIQVTARLEAELAASKSEIMFLRQKYEPSKSPTRAGWYPSVERQAPSGK
jgi:hypothetical protein